jgi:DNA polymerase elongation subunit (family B)
MINGKLCCLSPKPENEGYEGAIVLHPKPGIYVDTPISVLDYASLYPSSMISENISHDTIILDEKYDNLPGYEYVDITYDLFKGKLIIKRKLVSRHVGMFNLKIIKKDYYLVSYKNCLNREKQPVKRLHGKQ